MSDSSPKPAPTTDVKIHEPLEVFAIRFGANLASWAVKGAPEDYVPLDPVQLTLVAAAAVLSKGEELPEIQPDEKLDYYVRAAVGMYQRSLEAHLLAAAENLEGTLSEQEGVAQDAESETPGE